MTEHERLLAEVEPWLKLCGACDAALTMNCTCPKGDYRAVLAKVIDAYIAARPTEEQVKPAIDEPLEFASVVVTVDHNGVRRNWCRTYSVPVDEPWCSGNHLRSWPDVIEDVAYVEVLRVGLGEADPDVWKLQEDAWDEGARRFAAQLHGRLQLLYAEAITSERKNAYEKAIQAVEELAP